MNKKKTLIAFLIAVLALSIVPPFAIAETTDTTAPEFSARDNLFLYNDLTVGEAEKMLLQQIKVMDEIDGDVTNLTTFSIPTDFATRNWYTQSFYVMDRNGNKKYVSRSVYVLQKNKFFEGLHSLHLDKDDQIDLLQGVMAFDDKGNEISVEVADVKHASSMTYVQGYRLSQVENNLYKVGPEVDDYGQIYEIIYKSTDYEGFVRYASRYIDTSIIAGDPIITDLEISKEYVAPGEHVTISASIIDTTNDIDYIYVSFKYGSNYNTLSTSLRYNPISQKFEGNLKIPEGYENKLWKFNGSTINLNNGRYIYNRQLDKVKDKVIKVFNGVDLEKPEFQYSTSVQNLQLNEKVDVMQGITAFDLVDGDLTKQITTTGSVDNQKTGSYLVKYTVKDKAGNVGEFTKSFIVKDSIKPTITVKNPDITGYIQQGEETLRKMILDNVTASDNYDGDLTSKVTFTTNRDFSYSGTIKITYKVTDASGNTATAEAKMWLENFSSEYTIIGDVNKTILIGSNEELNSGFSLVDSIGHFIDYEVIGEVDYTKPGDYELIYRYTNFVGETFDLKRVITMKEKTPPTFTGLQTIRTTVGNPVDYIGDVVAYDMFGKRLSFNAFGSVDFNTSGTYLYHYNVWDSLGQYVEATRTIIVEGPFYDVPKGYPYYNEITRLKKEGIINGYPGNLFGPTDPISRGQVAALIYRSGISLTPVRESKSFKDVPGSHSFYKEIQALYQASIIDGMDENNFNPDDTLTREQLAKILVLAFKLENQGGYDKLFQDVANDRWSYAYITNLASNKVTIGYAGNYMPAGTVTREQYALFMYRALGY